MTAYSEYAVESDEVEINGVRITIGSNYNDNFKIKMKI
jgi:hypothetical protein